MPSKFALVIANTEYQDASFAKLTAPGKDAEEFAQVLRDLAAFDDVQVLLNEGEGKTRRSIAHFFSERKRDDLLLLYFSGHGVRNDVGQLFLAANDTEKNILEASGIPAEFVTQSMNNSRSQRQLLILDCCNSGAFAYGGKAASALDQSMGMSTAFEGTGFGRVVLTATDATQYAWEGDKVLGNTQKSVFTHFLIEGLKGEADRDSDGRIHVDELYDYAYEQVVRRTPKQTPGKWSYKQQGDIVLRENLQPREVKPASLPSDLIELLSHPNSSVRKVGIQDLITLLNGKHLGLARGAEEKLREIAENDDSFSFRKTAADALTARGLIVEQPAPVSVEIPKEKSKEEFKIEKPTRESPSPTGRGQGEGESRSNSKQKKVTPNPRLLAGIIGGLLVMALCAWGGMSLLNNLPVSPTESTQALQPTATRTFQPAKTDTPSLLTQTPLPPTPTLGIGSTMTGEDGMTLLYVPAGEFTMGSNEGGSNEKPTHRVFLDEFWIDKTEVTNGMYAKCVLDGACNSPTSAKSSSRETYFGDPQYDEYPVINVTWDNGKTYCEWVNRRLPTEAEWEKSARGTDDRNYPWGNIPPTSNLMNYQLNDTTEVGNYLNGASPYGALDMAGNVWEWVADWYRETYYSNSLISNPLGPVSGSYRGLRGGSWYIYRTYQDIGGNTYIISSGIVASWDRIGNSPETANNYTGFRCAMDATP
ncbi:MAG: SUMF1/EgtB/PvdO family nonheme iron enzyme [Anaerolineales bacterium]|nr:MAG: SUMF1/EgtB/PvdO family nonheme iron enzyme [Anaerolineales bacterium]